MKNERTFTMLAPLRKSFEIAIYPLLSVLFAGGTISAVYAATNGHEPS